MDYLSEMLSAHLLDDEIRKKWRHCCVRIMRLCNNDQDDVGVCHVACGEWRVACFMGQMRNAINPI